MWILLKALTKHCIRKCFPNMVRNWLPKLLFNITWVTLIGGFQICFAWGRSRNIIECIPSIPKRYAEEGVVPRELLAPSKSGVWVGSKATACGAGGTCEFGEGELRNEYEATQKSFSRGIIREPRRATKRSDVCHGKWICFLS